MRHRINFAVPCLMFLTLMLAVSHTQSAPTASPLNPIFGINSNIASRHPVFETLHVPADTVANLGAGWVREDFQFFRLQPEPDRYDWSWQDKMVDLFSERGISIIGVLNGPSPGWATPGSNAAASFYPPDPQRFAEFAYATVARYKGRIQYWQVWNEPDNPKYWQPESNSAAYANLLRTAYPEIKRANSDAQVLAASLVSPQPAARFLEDLHTYGAWDAFDIVSLHPYTDPKSPESGQIDVAGIGAVRGIVDNLGSKAIWATEFGWSTGPSDRTVGQGTPIDEQTQANYLVRGSVLLRSEGVDHIFWYNLKDTEDINGAPHNLYGLVRYDSSKASFDPSLQKDAYRSYQVMTEQLAGTTTASKPDIHNQVSIIDFETPATWHRGDEPNGELSQTREQIHSGSAAARLSYRFSTGGNDYVVFLAPSPIPIPGNPSKIGMWIYGDGSAHAVKVWLRDSQGEILQFRLGPVGGRNWHFVSSSLSGLADSGDVINSGFNRQLDFPASLYAIVLDDDPNEATGSGTIYLDDLVAITGSEMYTVRFNKGNEEVVDVIWAPIATSVSIPTRSTQATLVRAWGEATTITARNGQFIFDVGEDPIYLHHVPAPNGSSVVTTPTQLPVTDPTVPNDPDRRCFEATNQCIAGRIREYWEQNGGLPVFGYPTTPQRLEDVEGRMLQVQWFERNRLELHPENQPPYDVLLGRLGADRMTQQQRDWQTFPRSTEQNGCRFFPETGHNICGDILTAWQSNGLELDGRPGKTEGESLALFGMPLSDLQTETFDGKQIQVQWFERARFELHPENSPPHNVLLGLLGNEILAGQ